jgi:hypothetical protein
MNKYESGTYQRMVMQQAFKHRSRNTKTATATAENQRIQR